MNPSNDAPFKISILSFSKETLEEAGGKQVTLYQISVSSPLANWKLKRRFNDFFDMHQKLTLHFTQLPKLPQKTFFSLSSDADIENRRKELEKYLTELMAIDNVKYNLDFLDFLMVEQFFPEFVIQRPQILCRYETVPGLTFTDISYQEGRILNYTLSSKGIENPGAKLNQVAGMGASQSASVSHKAILNGFKFDDIDPVNIFQDKKVVKTFDLKAHCLQYFPEAAVIIVGFSEGVIAVYKEEKKLKEENEFLLTNVAKVSAGKDRITKILVNSKRGILYAVARTNKVKIVDMATWSVKETFKIGVNPILSIQIDESYDLGLSTEDGKLNIFDLTPDLPVLGKTLNICKGTLEKMEVDIDSGKIVCACAETGDLYLIDAEFPFSVVGPCYLGI